MELLIVVLLIVLVLAILYFAGDSSTTTYMNAISSPELTPLQKEVLNKLWRSGCSSAPQLSLEVELPSGSAVNDHVDEVVEALRVLESKGLVKVSVDPNDKRQYKYPPYKVAF